MNFGKSSQVWATMTFTNFLKALLILQIYDKTMGVRGNTSMDQVLDENLVSDLEGPGPPPPRSVPQRSSCFPRKKLSMAVCTCVSNSTRDYTVSCGQVSRRAFLTQMRQLSLQPPQCPFPSMSWPGYILCIPPTPLCDDRAWLQ